MVWVGGLRFLSYVLGVLDSRVPGRGDLRFKVMCSGLGA